jgi:hypothetical protein
MSADEWIRKVTQSIVTYWDTPADSRKRVRRDVHMHWADRFFGVGAYVWRRWWAQWRSRR